MTDTITLPTLENLKRQAKALRAKLDADGKPINHARALELMASQHGYKDWNTLHAAIGNRPVVCPVSIGQRVSGQYLNQDFTGEVVGIQILQSHGIFRVTMVFDNAVDVVTFEGMSNFRKRVSCTIGMDGKTPQKTSNGKPQLSLNLPVK